MHKSFFILVALCYSLLAKGQEPVKQWVLENTVPISTIDPDSLDFSDFEKIGDAIGDARIVMLGEQDHGDAPAFLAKTRLIKYLHEKKGFTVLAFESDFFAVNYNWQLVKLGKLTVDSFTRGNINTIWTACNTCSNLFKQYIPATQQTKSPLAIAGFDSQLGSRYLLPILDSELQRLKLPITALPAYRSAIFPLLTNWYKYTGDSATVDTIIGYYRTIKTQLLTRVAADDFWVQVADNLIQENIQFRYWKKDFWKNMNTRDRQMAMNLEWLCDIKYPNDKIIVWAHNYHISKYGGHYPDAFANAANTMGNVFTKDEETARKTYILGFTSYEGSAGRLFTKIYSVDKPEKNSFENWMHKEYQYAFIDFRRFNGVHPAATDPFYMSGATLGNNRYHSNYLAAWNKIFDGVFYIREMYPCKR